MAHYLYADEQSIPQQNEGLRPTAAEAEGLIKQALQLDPSHPLAIHLYIHIAEASSPIKCDQNLAPSPGQTPHTYIPKSDFHLQASSQGELESACWPQLHK